MNWELSRYVGSAGRKGPFDAPIAKFARLTDAMILVRALHATGGLRNLQLWYKHQGRLSFSAEIYARGSYGDKVAADAEVLRLADEAEKKWRAGRALQRKIQRFMDDENALITAAKAWAADPETPYKRALFTGDFAGAKAALQAMRPTVESEVAA